MAGNRKRPVALAGKTRKTNFESSVVEKLNVLRSLGLSDLSESDLSRCLSQSGYNVGVAAERLVTGQFQPSKKAKHRSFPNVDIKKNNSVVDNITKSSASLDSKKTSPPSKVKKAPNLASNLVSPKCNSPSQSNITSNSLTIDERENCNDWLLCHRWISDGVNLRRGACCDYQEKFIIHLDSSRYQKQSKPNKNIDRSLRFFSQTRRTEGSFPRYLALILCPLLRNGFIHVKATALMEETKLKIGSTIAFNLSVYIINPLKFFAIFEDDNENTIVDSYSKQFFAAAAHSSDISNSEKKRQNLKGNNHLRAAAFSLLQWAQHGEVLPILEEKPNEKDDEDDDDNDNDADNNEKDIDETAIPKWAEGVLRSRKGPDSDDNSDAENSNDTPLGFRAGVQLRQYQKESLHWMIQREANTGVGTTELLDILNELSGIKSSIRRDKEDEVVLMLDTKVIKCDVGPVLVNTNRIEVPSVSGPSDAHQNYHPLWERRFLCNDQQTKALSFFVQPCFGNAKPFPPLSPAPCRGGILADEMGLGKTVQLLALVQADKDNEGDSIQNKNNGTLVVCPLSLLQQWKLEIENKTHLTHFVHYNDGKKASPVHNDKIDVVLTTYGQLQAEFRSLQKESKITGPILSKNWKRVILDECHVIKNHQTVVAKACCSIRAERRWCVSGTIIQNSLEDVYSLMRFLRHDPFCEKAFWNRSITKVIDFSTSLERVKKILSPIMIRRTKKTCDKDGKPILILPDIDYKSVAVDFFPEERQFYEALYNKSFAIFKGLVRSGTVSSSWLKIFSLLQRLRQTCSHVALTVKAHLDDGEWASKTTMVHSIENHSSTKSNTKIESRTKNDDSIDLSFLKDLHQKFKSMQDTSEINSNNCSNDDSNDEYASSIAHMLNDAIRNKSSELDECPICLENINLNESLITPCLHLFCRECLLNYTKKEILKKGSNTTSASCPVCSKEIDVLKILEIKKINSGIHTSFIHREGVEPSPMSKTSHCDEDEDARKTLQIAIQGSSSSKIVAIHKELKFVWEKEPKSKVLIFSQYLGLLDILQKSFKANDIPYKRLDGSLKLKERMEVLNDFGSETSRGSSSPNSNIGSVLLISMKAGGVGLNLVAARSVFIVDPWWNAAVEDQCVDRIHRIGQTAETIYVRKFFVVNSIEERILELQKRKKSISRAALSEDTEAPGAIGARPSLEDFKVLFGESQNY